MVAKFHSLHRVPREVRKKIRRRHLQRLREPHENRKTRHLPPQLQIADVVSREIGRLSQLLLREAAFFPELAEAAAEKLRFLHIGIPHCRWNKVLQRALECAFSSKALRKSRKGVC